MSDPLAVRRAIEAVVDLVESTSLTPEERLSLLPCALDWLAAVAHGVSGALDPTSYPDGPSKDYQATFAMVGRHFPTLGYYNVAQSITGSIAEGSICVGDAIDDIADIVGDLQDVLWRWNNTSEGDALWEFRRSFTSHWGRHLRELQLYLHVIAIEDGV
jgi:hypothetical protein